MEAILVCLLAFLSPEAFNFYMECIRTKMIKRIVNNFYIYLLRKERS